MGTFLVPTAFRKTALAAQLHLHPTYREPSPLDSLSSRINPTLAESPLEFYHDKLAPALQHLLTPTPKDIQITSLQINGNTISTKIRYETVTDSLEQRIGTLLVDWDLATFKPIRTTTESETRQRAPAPFFTDVTDHAFSHNPSYAAQLLHGADYWRTVLDGATGIDIYGHNGISVGDINGDGFDDIYICQPAGLPNRLFRNRHEGTFEDITESSGIGILDNTACALFADFRNTGHQDLLVVRTTGPLLFINDGTGKFHRQPNAFKFANPPQGTFTGAAAADYNRDGLLDIYFCLYTYYQGTDQYKYPSPYYAAENGPPNFMMRNNGDGTFTDVTAQTGLNQNNTRYSFCCAWGHIDHSIGPSLYVVNDFGRKNLYRNNGDGTFTDVAPAMAAEDIGAGMSVCWLDYNNDGLDDLYIANMWTAAGERLTADPSFQTTAPKPIQSLYRKHAMGNSLLQNDHDTFLDKTQQSNTGIGRWSWSSDSFDFNHDGFADIYIANGMITGPIQQDLNSFFWREVVAKSPNTPSPDPNYESGWNAINELIRSDYSWSGSERNILYINNQNGTFSDVSGISGLDFREDSRAFALSDFNHDGRQELILKNRNAPQLRLLQNSIPNLPPSITFQLQGTKSNRDAIGAVITLETTTRGQQTKTIRAGSAFLSQHTKEIHFGLGVAEGPISATIHWPSGVTQQFTNLPANHRIHIIESESEPSLEPYNNSPTYPPSQPKPTETLPTTCETWLLAPVLAPDQRPGPTLVTFSANNSTDETAALYGLLFRYLFDRHQDLPLPTSFLLNKQGEIVKVYQGPVKQSTVQNDLANIPATNPERLAKALPFPINTNTFDFGRNNLTLGSIYFQRGYPDPAKLYYQAANKEDPTSAEALYGLGSVYLRQQNNAQAKDYFTQVTSLRPNYPETLPNAWNNLGILATRENNLPIAVTLFQRALKIEPNHFISLLNLGNAYRQQSQLSEARPYLEQALAIKPNDPEANYSLGMLYAVSEDTTHAEEYLMKALKYRPVYPEALNNLGILYLQTRRRDEAVASFETSIRRSPNFARAYLNLARVYLTEHNNTEARKVLKALLTQEPGNPTAIDMLTQIP